MVWVPGGKFFMGCEDPRMPDAQPIHPVELDGFWMDETPVTNEQFTRTLNRVLRRPTLLPTPTFALKAMFGREAVDEMFLGGQRVTPARLQADGYAFRHADLEGALRHLLHKGA